MDKEKVFITSQKYQDCYIRVCELYTEYYNLCEEKKEQGGTYKANGKKERAIALNILLAIEKANTIARMSEGYDITYWGFLENNVYERDNGKTSIGSVQYTDGFKKSEYYREEYWIKPDGVTVFYYVRDLAYKILGVERG